MTMHEKCCAPSTRAIYLLKLLSPSWNIKHGLVDGAQQVSCIVMTRHLLTNDLRHGCLGPIGDHFDRVDEMFALRAQTIEARLLGQFFVGDVPFRSLTLSFEFINLLLQLGDGFLQVGLALRKGLDFFRLDVAIQVYGAELSSLSFEKADFTAHLPVERAVGGVDDPSGLRDGFGAIVNNPIQIEALSHITEEVFLRPSSEHGWRQHRAGAPVISGQERRLVTALGQLADLAHP